MIQTTVELKGLDQIEAALRELPVQLQRQVLREGLKFGARVMLDGMQRRAPRSAEHRVVRRGKSYPLRLSEALRTRVRIRKDGDPIALIGPSKAAYWGRFVEQGTRFQQARSFMKATLNADGQIAVSAFAAGAKIVLERVVRRLRRMART